MKLLIKEYDVTIVSILKGFNMRKIHLFLFRNEKICDRQKTFVCNSCPSLYVAKIKLFLYRLLISFHGYLALVINGGTCS